MIDVKDNEDGSFTISWDENDPLESVFNDWTEEDFINYFRAAAEETLAAEDFCENSKKLREESGETSIISEATEKDWQSFWEGDDISDQESDTYLQATNQETYGDQGNEL